MWDNVDKDWERRVLIGYEWGADKEVLAKLVRKFAAPKIRDVRTHEFHETMYDICRRNLKA